MKFTFEVWTLATSGDGRVIEEHVFESLAEAREFARARAKQDVDKGLEYDYSIVGENDREYHIYSDREEPIPM